MKCSNCDLPAEYENFVALELTQYFCNGCVPVSLRALLVAGVLPKVKVEEPAPSSKKKKAEPVNESNSTDTSEASTPSPEDGDGS